MKSNLHTHTTWCDGKNTPREMVETALSLGFHTLGFSSHSYTPFDTSFCLKDSKGYVREIRTLQKEYEGRIQLLLGVELDALGECDFDPDYIIGAAHYVTAKGMHYIIDNTYACQRQLIDEGFGGNAMDAVKAYFESLPEMVYRKKPDIVAHFDVFAKFNEQYPVFDEQSEEYLALAYAAVDGIMEGCKLFEVNTGGVYRGYRAAPYPALPILKYIHDRGGEVVITTDAHKTEGLNFGFDKAKEVIRQAGFERLRVMTPNGWANMLI